MKRTVITMLGAVLVIGGLTALVFSFVHFVHAVPVGAGENYSTGWIGLYLPWYTAPAVIALAAGLILLMVRKFF